MIIEERKEYICKLLENQTSVTVKDLSKRFSLSEVSVRKLLLQMEEQGLLKRSWGGAMKISKSAHEFAYEEKVLINPREKNAICKLAYEKIQDGETIYIDCGTTSFSLAKLIANGDKKLIVVTNAFNLVAVLKRNRNVQVIIIGGELRHSIYSSVGTIAISTIKNLVFDRSFITGDNFSCKRGFSASTLQDAEVKQQVILSSKSSFVIMDSSKYGDDSMAIFAKLTDVTAIITDWGIEKQDINTLKKYGVIVLVAPNEED